MDEGGFAASEQSGISSVSSFFSRLLRGMSFRPRSDYKLEVALICSQVYVCLICETPSTDHSLMSKMPYTHEDYKEVS